MDALSALSAVDFQWTVHMDGVWRDPRHDVPAIHAGVRAQLLGDIGRIQQSADASSPLGSVLVGGAGAGKTHLLSALRREAMNRGAGFVLVDMTDVHDFWSNTLLGYLESLQKRDASGLDQFQQVLSHVIETSAPGEPDVQDLAEMVPPRLVNQMDRLVNAIGRHHRSEMHKHQDVLRALVLLNANEFELSNLGYGWLQGHGIGEDQMDKYAFAERSKDPRSLVRGLSWLMSLRGPTVLALDQLDAFVTQHSLLAAAPAETREQQAKQQVARSILEGLGAGLMELRDATRRTLIVVTCIETTWQTLQGTALRTAMDRYQPPRALHNIESGGISEQLVTRRLDDAYATCGFTPPHPTWPFAPRALQEAANVSPRELLKKCESHRRACLDAGEVWELRTFAKAPAPTVPQPVEQPQYAALDRELEELRAAPDAVAAATSESEEELGAMLIAACRCLLAENPVPDNVDAYVEEDFPTRKKHPPLHARVRLMFREENDRECHLCMRAIEQSHAIAYQARLKAAMTASGIDRHLEFRHLVILRSGEIPGGPKTRELTESFHDAGGEFLRLTEEEKRTLWGLGELMRRQRANPSLPGWQRLRRPASSLRGLKPAVAWLFGRFDDPAAEERMQSAKPRPDESTTQSPEPARGTKRQAPRAALDAQVPLGSQVVGGRMTDAVLLPARALTEHVAVLAGSGAGKTVLLRRLVEELALIGVPSVLIDGANDLARLGDRWPEQPDGWHEGDDAKAASYHSRAEVIVWTPGIEAGNPLSLAPLPDLAAVADDVDELERAVQMATGALGDVVAKGRSETNQTRRGVLASALQYFAAHGGGSLEDLIALLKDLPLEAGSGISNAAKLGVKMADALLARIQVDPLLKQQGAELDPSVLFGVDDSRDKTRVSVLSFAGLSNAETQQQFVNQLAMTLFSWIRRNPCPPDLPLRGVLVVDEAKDLIPSQASNVCKQSLLRLSAQARKYGLGLVFATQAPRSVDHNVIANCATQFYGKASSPAAIETVREQIRLRGGTGNDVPRLAKGHFYFHTSGLPAPTRIAVPLCLSHHPASPLDESQVIDRSIRSRARLARG